MIAGYSDSGVQGDHITNADPLILTGTADPGIEVSIYAGDVLLGTTIADSTGAWSFTVPNLADGSHSFTATIGKGAHLIASEPLVLELDRTATPPEITFATASETGLLLAGTAEAGSEVSVYRNGNPVGTVTADQTGHWEMLDAGFSAGEKVTYWAESTDIAGNESVASTDFVYPNDAPEFASAASVSVAENQTAVLDVQATDDSDAEGAGLAYAITGGVDAPLFEIDPATGVLTFKSPPDYESPADDNVDNVYEVRVSVTDSDGLTAVQDIAVTVTDVTEAPGNTAPAFTSLDAVSVPENQTAVLDVQATDDTDAEGNGLVYSITGGDDGARFSIDAATGVLTFLSPPSYEAPSDTGGDNIYGVQVTVTDSGGLTAVQDIAVTVTDEPEAPTIVSAASVNVPENQTAVLDVQATDDRDAEHAGLAYAISGGVDAALFDIDPDTGVLVFLSAPDFEIRSDADSDNVYEVRVTVTDADGMTDSQDLAVTVTDVNEDSFIFETRVAVSLDDVEERASGSVIAASTDLELAVDGSRQQTVGLRFTGIEVPQGAIITNAYIQFQADEADTGASSLTIRGEDTGDAAAFATTDFNVSSRAMTDAFVSWSPGDWTTIGEAGAAQRTPDLSAIVQEIASRGDWAALNDLVFTITGTGTRTAEAFDGRAAAAPLLHIEYSLPGPASAPVAFGDPADADTAANRIAELAAAGTAVGITASAADPDAGDTVSYSVDDARFAIDANGVVTRSGGGVLDFESTPSVALTVVAHSSDGSIASQVFTVDLSDSPEPVVFDDPADVDGSVNRIAHDAAAGTEVGITAAATDPDAGSSVSYSIDDARFTIGADGVVTRSTVGTLDAGAEPIVSLTVTAMSSDGSTATHGFDVSVIPETLPQTLTLAKVTDTGQWSPSSPDPSGLAYVSHLGALFVSDGEVNEMPIFTGVNLFMATLGGDLTATLTTVDFSDEPAGAAYNPDNRHLFFSDDTGRRSVYELDPGGDGEYNTADDVVTSIRTEDFGSSDPEGLAYDAGRGVLYVADGVTATIYTVDPGANGRFDGMPSRGGDDVATSFDAGALGIEDPEGIEYDPRYDILYITSGTDIAMMSTSGELLGLLDISSAGARNPAGLALAPSSADPDTTSLYLVARGIDNNSDPDENDGKLYEFVIDDPLMV